MKTGKGMVSGTMFVRNNFKGTNDQAPIATGSTHKSVDFPRDSKCCQRCCNGADCDWDCR